MTDITRIRNHVKDRALMRLGVELSTKDYKVLTILIKNNKAIEFKKTYPPKYRNWYKVYYNGRYIIVIYDAICGMIKTVLPIAASPEYKYVSRKI